MQKRPYLHRVGDLACKHRDDNTLEPRIAKTTVFTMIWSSSPEALCCSATFAKTILLASNLRHQNINTLAGTGTATQITPQLRRSY